VLVAEIDPAVTRVATERLWVAEDRRIEVMHSDARVAVRRLPERPQFDLVLTDVFHDIAMPAHLVTREFHRELRTRLASDGIYAVNVIDGGTNPVFLRSFVRTLADDFPAVEVWADAAEAASQRRITYVVLAMAAPSPADTISLPEGRRIWRRLAPTGDASAVPILTDDYAPVDRLLSGVLLDRDLGER
jgi:spermidine synthase